MKRREFITLIGGAAAAWSSQAHAQQPTVPVIGLLTAGSPEPSAHLVAAFRKGLSDTGYVEGQNVAIEYRWANGQLNLLPSLAADLVNRRVAVLVASGSEAAQSAKSATATIPIVFNVADPVGQGLASSLNRPGGNTTGVNLLAAELGPKRFELLRELAPKAVSIALLVNPGSPVATLQIAELQERRGPPECKSRY